MSRITKIILVLMTGWVAAMSVRYAFGSITWQHVRHFIYGLPWSSLEVANFFCIAADVLLTALLGGVHTTLLVMWTRLSAASAAAALSAAVFFAAEPGVLLNTLNRGMDIFFQGHIKLTAVFFFGGWLIAPLVQRNYKNGSKAPDTQPIDTKREKTGVREQ